MSVYAGGDLARLEGVGSAERIELEVKGTILTLVLSEQSRGGTTKRQPSQTEDDDNCLHFQILLLYTKFKKKNPLKLITAIKY